MTNRKQDPTGQARNRKKSTKRLARRLRSAESLVKSLFLQIPRSPVRRTRIVNQQVITFYEYDITPIQSEQLQRQIEFILNDQLLETQTDTMRPDWYWKQDVEVPYRQGTVEEVRDFNQMVVAAAAAGVVVRGLAPQPLSIEQVLFSETYRTALQNVQVENFAVIRTLSQRTANQVIQVINSGISAGNSSRTIASDISGRFDVARSSAQRIADTEINKAYNNAKLDATTIMGDQTGLRPAVIHISALLPTTRDTHAARHGNAYTIQDQRRWWDTGSNRINCHCSTRSVLIDSKGNVVQEELQEEIKQERSFFN